MKNFYNFFHEDFEDLSYSIQSRFLEYLILIARIPKIMKMHMREIKGMLPALQGQKHNVFSDQKFCLVFECIDIYWL